MDYDRNERSGGGFDPQQQPDPTPAAPRGEQPPAQPPENAQYGQYASSGPEQSTVAVPAFVLGLVGLLLSLPTSCACYGVPAVIGCALGIVAWVMGHRERARVAAGEIAPNGLLTAGWVMGIIATIMALVVLLAAAVFIALIAIGAVSEGSFNSLGR